MDLFTLLAYIIDSHIHCVTQAYPVGEKTGVEIKDKRILPILSHLISEDEEAEEADFAEIIFGKNRIERISFGRNPAHVVGYILECFADEEGYLTEYNTLCHTIYTLA